MVNIYNISFKRFIHIISRRTRPRIILALLVFWIILTGSLEWEFLLVGFLVSFFITTFWGGFILPPTPGKDVFIHPSLFLIIFEYLEDFIIDVIIANIQVARIVLNPRLPINPGFIKYNLDLDFETSRVLLANSITLTPGTLTVYLSGKIIIVHALTKEAAKDVLDWDVQHDLERFEEVEQV